MSLFSKVKRNLKHLFSDEISKDIESVEACIRIINGIPNYTDNYWLAWYKSCLDGFLKFFKAIKINPALFVPLKNKMAKHMIDKIRDNDRLKLKDIYLPLPITNADCRAILHIVFDSLLTYLVDDVDQEILYSIVPRCFEGPYEYKSVRLEHGDVLIDAGASVGDFSAFAGVKGCTAFAFEPISNVIENYLSKTAKWNPNIKICKFALSTKREELSFNESGLTGGSVSKAKNNAKVKVQAIDLDSFVNENNLSSVDFIKADIEGAERYLLMGAKSVLKEFSPKVAICTYHLPDDPEVLRNLILEANPNYVVEEKWKKIFAYVPKK